MKKFVKFVIWFIVLFIVFSSLMSKNDRQERNTSTETVENIETVDAGKSQTIIPVSNESNVSNESIVSDVEKWLAEGFDHYWVTYNEKNNNLMVNIAMDGLATSMIAIKHAGNDENYPIWVQTKGVILTLHDELSNYLTSAGYSVTNLIVQLVNDDAYIREDYSTIQYNPLFSVSTLSLKGGFVLCDFME